MRTLFELPSELRNYIWELTFKDHDITPQAPSDFNRGPCTSCTARNSLPLPYEEVFTPLLVCKQMHREAQPLLHSTLNLHISDAALLERIHQSSRPMRRRVKTLTLTLHLDEDNRMEWLSSLLKLPSIFPHLRHLIVHSHMRPPTSYENLIDSVFLAAPLVILTSQIQHTLHFDYILEDVMFISPFVGEIRCSDALEEHELVIRDVLVDETFKSAAEAMDLTQMTAVMLKVARLHERPWFEKLQRRRNEELNRQATSEH